jgi:hypothetical protein
VALVPRPVSLHQRTSAGVEGALAVRAVERTQVFELSLVFDALGDRIDPERLCDLDPRCEDARIAAVFAYI